MLERVVQALEASPSVGQIWTSIDVPPLLNQAGNLGRRVENDKLTVIRSADSPSASVLEALETIGSELPLLVTTADHALLNPEIVEFFVRAAQKQEADLCVGLVREKVIRQQFPDTERTFIPLRGNRYSGANLFVLRTAAAQSVIQFWRRTEMHRKHPWRLVWEFGPVALLLFLLRRLDLEQAFSRASKIVGARIVPVEIPQAEAAIDVDRLSDYEQVREILERRPTEMPR